MNLGALARSLSNGLRFGATSKKQLEPLPTESVRLSIPSALSSLGTPARTSSTSSRSSIPRSSCNETTDESSKDPDHLSQTVAQINQCRLPYKQTVEQILDKVSELEHTLYEDQQQEFKLRMALDYEKERVHELNFSLSTEKQRNARLVQLLRGVETETASDSEPESQLLDGMRFHSKCEMLGSISPLLMQQRYDELYASHRQTQRLLAKKEKTMKLLKCDLEVLRGKYDAMCDDYRSEQRRLEALSTRYMQMQEKKKQQVYILKETLGYASDCILNAQMTIDRCERGEGINEKQLTLFNQNLELFMRALRNCCCMRKLQQLQKDQGVDVDEELLNLQLNRATDNISASNNSKCPAQLTNAPPKRRRHHRKLHKH